MNATTSTKRSNVDDRYGDLLKSVQPHRIENDDDYEEFQSLLVELLEKEEDEGELSAQESRLVDLLLILVLDYEERLVKLPASTPLDILIHLMETKELKQADLVNVIGSSGIVSEVVNGKREISKAQARSLSTLFNVSYKLFL